MLLRAASEAAPADDAPLKPATVERVLNAIAWQLYLGSHLKLRQWAENDWYQDPDKLQNKVVTMLTIALIWGDLVPKIPKPEDIAAAGAKLVGAGFRYAALPREQYDPTTDEGKSILAIQELTKITNALMRLMSSQPNAKPPRDLVTGTKSTIPGMFLDFYAQYTAP